MFYHFIKKEFLLISRDIHALLVLFVMPLLFIFVMSYALKNNFSGIIDVKYEVAYMGDEKLDNFKSSFFNLNYLKKDINKKDIFLNDNYDFLVEAKKNQINIYAKSNISPQYISILKSHIQIAMQEKILNIFMNEKDLNLTIKSQFIGKNGLENKISSTDHNVPAWLVFSMFFILIPISNTFINEKDFGTFSRLKSMNVSPFLILSGKFVPYLVVNQIQVLAMLLVGIYIMPLFNLDALQIKSSFLLIFLVSLSVSFAAISFGLLIANIAKTSEEATTIGGVSNIILAAIGGIMVPSFVMPKAMQNMSELSPLSWAMQSFSEVLVYGGNFSDISFYMVKLYFFAIICFFISGYLISKKGEVH